MKRNILATLWFILICPLCLLAEPPWQQHGKLQLSKNGHTIQHKDGTGFLWIGDTAWGMFQQLTREEVIYAQQKYFIKILCRIEDFYEGSYIVIKRKI